MGRRGGFDSRPVQCRYRLWGLVMPLEQKNLFGSSDGYSGAAVMPNHDGATYNHVLDKKRLNGLMGRVFELMQDGVWRTYSEIVAKTGGSEGGVGARLRDLRKEPWGSHTVNIRRRGDGKRGLFEYQLIVNERTT